MAKSTEDKIKKLEEAILKEELRMEEIKEKISKYQSELKKLKAEQEQKFAMEILKALKEKGIDKDQFLNELKISESAKKVVPVTDEKIQK